jgi:hypothetical protein
MHSISDTWWGNSFFTTEHGRVGLALQGVAPGDCIGFFFFGALYPLALRRTLQDAKYRILGRAYVDQLMNGEVFDLHGFEKNGYETFTIA